MYTSEVQKVGILMEFVEHRSRSVLDVCCREDGYAVRRKGGREVGSSLCIFDSTNAGCDWPDLMSIRRKAEGSRATYARQASEDEGASHAKPVRIVHRQPRRGFGSVAVAIASLAGEAASASYEAVTIRDRSFVSRVPLGGDDNGTTMTLACNLRICSARVAG